MTEVIIDCFSAVIFWGVAGGDERQTGLRKTVDNNPVLNVDKYRDCFPAYLKWEFKWAFNCNW